MKNELTWIEISRSALRNNVDKLRSIANGAKLAPPVKGNAYGHGMIEVANELIGAGVEWLSVTNVQEAVDLRKNGIEVPILVFGAVLDREYELVATRGLTLVVHDVRTARGISGAALKLNLTVDVHIEIDTGMHRQGMLEENIGEFMEELSVIKGIRVTGLMTHFATSDELDDDGRRYFDNQLSNFNELATKLEVKYPSIIERHCANSGALLGHKLENMTIARPGISTYGMWPSESVQKNIIKDPPPLKEGLGVVVELQPALSWKTRVVQIKDLPEGAHISYGCTYVTREPKQVAVIPVGYYDGLFRSMSNKGEVLINGQRAQILGRVCMNHTIVDVSSIDGVELNDEVVLIGIQGNDRITAEYHAQWEGTINYEIVTKLPKHINRILKK